MNVFQVLITDTPIDPCDLSPPVLAAMQSVKDCFPDTTHRLVQRPEIEKFLVQYFDRGVLDLFRGLAPYAYKSDLLDIVCFMFRWLVCRFNSKDVDFGYVADHIDMIVFADRGCMSMCQPWAIQNGLLYSKPGNPIFFV